MLSASNNLSSPKVPEAAFTSHSSTRPNNGTRSWASIVAGPSPPITPKCSWANIVAGHRPPQSPKVPCAPRLQAFLDHQHPEIPTIMLGEPLVPLDRPLTPLGYADWRNVTCNGFTDPPSVFTRWNMGVPRLDVYGYPIDGYPWKATYGREHSPHSLDREQPIAYRIVYTANPVPYDTITRLPSPVKTTRTSNDLSILEEMDAMTISRIPMLEKNPENIRYVDSPSLKLPNTANTSPYSNTHYRGARRKETSKERSERRRRNGGRKRNATWLARHEIWTANKKPEEK